MSKAQPITVFLPDTRGVELSPFGSGNMKIGFGVYTYSRLPGDPALRHVGDGVTREASDLFPQANPQGTCPGSTVECEAICYAKRIDGVVRGIHRANSMSSGVPPIPQDCHTLRIHISGDFDSVDYIQNWVARLTERPDVVCWVYTRSWRVADLLPALEVLRALPNVQMFASVDPSMTELPPTGWRRAWIWRTFTDGVTGPWGMEDRLIPLPGAGVQADGQVRNMVCTIDSVAGLVCPEETGDRRNCVECGYCFKGKKNDVIFLEHHGPKK